MSTRKYGTISLKTAVTTVTPRFHVTTTNFYSYQDSYKDSELKISSPVGVGVVGDDGVRNDPSVVVVKSGDVIMLLALLLVGNPGVIKSMPNKDDATNGEGVL